MHNQFTIIHCSKLYTSYELNNSAINSLLSHKDLGVIISTNLEWHHHHDYMCLAKYTKFLVSFDVLSVNQIQLALKLNYIASYLPYQITGHLLFNYMVTYLIRDITKLEQVQWRTTKYVHSYKLQPSRRKYMHSTL